MSSVLIFFLQTSNRKDVRDAHFKGGRTTDFTLHSKSLVRNHRGPNEDHRSRLMTFYIFFPMCVILRRSYPKMGGQILSSFSTAVCGVEIFCSL